MPHDDDTPDDEDWYDDDSADNASEETAGQCPECRGPVYEFTTMCPACGYYLTDADQRRLWSSAAKPKWVLITAALILTILVFGALTLTF